MKLFWRILPFFFFFLSCMTPYTFLFILKIFTFCLFCRHMVVPGRENLFTTLANNLYIINQQKNRLESLVKELTSLRLYNKAANPAPNRSTTAAATAAGWEQETSPLCQRATATFSPVIKSNISVAFSPLYLLQVANVLVDKFPLCSLCTQQFGKWTRELERCSSENQAGVHVATTQWQISEWVALISSCFDKIFQMCYCFCSRNNCMCVSLVSKISPVKQSQLRNFLSKGQMPPVRSTAPGMSIYTLSAFVWQFITK